MFVYRFYLSTHSFLALIINLINRFLRHSRANILIYSLTLIQLFNVSLFSTHFLFHQISLLVSTVHSVPISSQLISFPYLIRILSRICLFHSLIYAFFILPSLPSISVSNSCIRPSSHCLLYSLLAEIFTHLIFIIRSLSPFINPLRSSYVSLIF